MRISFRVINKLNYTGTKRVETGKGGFNLPDPYPYSRVKVYQQVPIVNVYV